MSTIKRVITEYLGERCPDFDADCLCCKAWKEYDGLRIAGKLEGLREAAQILSGYLKAGNTAGLQTGLLQDSLDDILARIAELENLRHE